MAEKPTYETPVVEVLTAGDVIELLGVVDCQGQSGGRDEF